MRLVNSLLGSVVAAGAIMTIVLFLPGSTPATSQAATSEPAPASPSNAAGFGTIKGKLIWNGEKTPEPVAIEKNKSIDVCKEFDLVKNGMPVDPKTKGVGAAFAYVLKSKTKNPEAEKTLLEKKPEVVIDNRNCEFVPYSTAVFKDQNVIFQSSDPISHNSHITGFSQGKNVMIIAKGKEKMKLQVESRPIALACDIHPWMEGKIMVFDHPFFAVTGADGSFEITGVPEGSQMLVVRLSDGVFITPAAGMPVTVKAGETVDVGPVLVDPAKVKIK